MTAASHAIAHHPAWITLQVAFTIFSIAVLVQFFRKRHSYFLQKRSPRFAFVQLLTSMLFWNTTELVTLVVPVRLQDADSSECVVILGSNLLVLRRLFLSAFLSLLAWRIWKLFWRQYLGDHLSAQRRQIRRIGSHASRLPAHQIPKVTRRFLALKYGVPAYLTTVTCVQFCTTLYGFGVCDSSRGMTSMIPGSAFYACIGMFFMVVGFLVRKFSDNCGFAREFKCYGLVSIVALIMSIVGFSLPSSVGHTVLVMVATLAAQVMFVIGGFVPINDQRKLEKRIAVDDFEELGKFDGVLHDPACLIAFTKFMEKEFCGELLEFYQVVANFKRMFALRTSNEQRNAASIIYASYVADAAPSQINISSEALGRLHTAFFGESCAAGSARRMSSFATVIREDVFDEAQREMYKLMRDGPFVRFRGMQDETAGRRRSRAAHKIEGIVSHNAP